MKRLYNALIYLQHKIENDTDTYLESDFVNVNSILPDITIKYKDVSIDIPLDLAESNDFIQGTIIDLKTLIKEMYL